MLGQFIKYVSLIPHLGTFTFMTHLELDGLAEAGEDRQPKHMRRATPRRWRIAPASAASRKGQPVKQYQLFVRLTALDQWSYVDTIQGAQLAWTYMMQGRARGCQCKVTRFEVATAPADVFVVPHAH